MERKPRSQEYEIMHMEQIVARISTAGVAQICREQFMPYDLVLEETEGIDEQVNNLMVFYNWCASRMLTLDRQHSKEILNSINCTQATTDKDRAMIALSYHCLTLTDVYWVRRQGECVTFGEINLYNHHLNDALVDVSLLGKQLTITNQELITELAPDISTRGVFAKAWIRTRDGFQLLKDGATEAVETELLASQIYRCFDVKQVKYEPFEYQGEKVTKSNLLTSQHYSMVSKMAFDIYAQNHDFDALEEIRKIDPYTYYAMNILDYLVGNTDRHPENWGLLVDNSTNQYLGLYPLMDFNQSFLSYDQLEGANCQAVFPRHMTQLEAALEAMGKIQLRQLQPINMKLFDQHATLKEMFLKRLDALGMSL